MDLRSILALGGPPAPSQRREPNSGSCRDNVLAMGVLTVDLSAVGVVMSADSQPIEALNGRTRILGQQGQRHTRNPIVRRTAAGFAGFTGFVGTERIGTRTTRNWLDAFGSRHPSAPLADYATAMGQELTAEWQAHGIISVLEILISGVEKSEVRFWYVRNSQGLNADGTYVAPAPQFKAVNDLDRNYVPLAVRRGLTKEQLLQQQMLSFRQGDLRPAATVFDAFAEILSLLYAHGIPGFTPIASVDDLGYFARQRLEFVKRLYSQKHGIHRQSQAPIGGKVHVVGVDRKGVVQDYYKSP
jgi:hypothetical protein